MKLVLIRHGESVWNKENLFTGWTDVDLSDTGRKEAAEAGRILKEEGFDFDICYTSYLKRAIHTLNYVLEGMDREWLPVIKTWKLNERHYGALQGFNKSETAEKYELHGNLSEVSSKHDITDLGRTDRRRIRPLFVINLNMGKIYTGPWKRPYCC